MWHLNRSGNRNFSCFAYFLLYDECSHHQNIPKKTNIWMENQSHIAGTPDPARVSPAPVAESLVPTGTHHHWRQDSRCAGE
jgi:hypothetical protein